MHLKTYKAPDLASALALARAELGPHALVLATNEIRGGMGLTTVEITVAVERASAPALAPPPPVAWRAENVAPRTAAPRTPGRGADPAPSLRGAALALVRAGLSKDLAMRFARIAFERGASRGVPEDVVGSALTALVPLRPVRRASVTFVVGPPGCGKTTTAAKLAARWALEDGKRIVLAQADADRIGAVEQAGIFAKSLGLRLAPLRARADLVALERDARGGSILVDTAGVGGSDAERLHFLAELRHAATDAEVALLLPAGLHREEARRVVDRFAPIEPTCVVLSKVDDGARPGELLNAVEAAGLPIALFTTGHRVPQDLEDASPARLANLLLRSGWKKESSRAV